MTKNCPVSHEKLMAYREAGALSAAEAWWVRRHLRRCAACQREVEIMNQISEQVKSVDVLEKDALSPALRAKLMERVAEAAAETSPKPEPGPDANAGAEPRPRRRRFSTPRLVEWGGAVGVCLIVVVAAAMMTGTHLTPPFDSGSGSTAAMAPADARAVQPENIGGVDTMPNDEIAKEPRSSVAGEPPADYEIPIYGDGKLVPAERVRRPRPEAEKDRVKRDLFAAAGRKQRIIGGLGGVAGGSAPANFPKSWDADSDLPEPLRRVHKEASITVEVADVEQSSANAEKLIAGAGGFALSNTLTTGADGLKTANLTLRVPVGKFESALSQVAALGNVKAKNITGEDITERYSNTEQKDNVLGSELAVREAQLRAAEKREAAAKRRSERRGTSFVSSIPWEQRAEVRQLRIEVAQTRARLKLLRKISDLANLEVQLREKAPVPGETGLLQEIGGTAHEALSSFLLALRVPLNLLIWLLAYSPLWLPALFAWRALVRIYNRGATNG